MESFGANFTFYYGEGWLSEDTSQEWYFDLGKLAFREIHFWMTGHKFVQNFLFLLFF